MENPLCRNYRMFKTTPQPSPYLTLLPTNQRIALCKFRTRCHNLPICAQRFNNKNTPESKLKCPLCDSNDVGDEFHYIFKCKALNAMRIQRIPKYFLLSPNVLKFQELFESSDPILLSQLAKFAAHIMECFNHEKIESPVKLRAVHVTRAGRVSKPPARLQIN